MFLRHNLCCNVCYSLVSPCLVPIVFFSPVWASCCSWKLSEWTHSITPFPSFYPYGLSSYLLLTVFSFSALSARKFYSNYVLLGSAFLLEKGWLPCVQMTPLCTFCSSNAPFALVYFKQHISFFEGTMFHLLYALLYSTGPFFVFSEYFVWQLCISTLILC